MSNDAQTASNDAKTAGAYEAAFRASVEDPENFWLTAAEAVDWDVAPTRALDDSRAPIYRWFPDARAQHLRQRARPARRAPATGTGPR